MIYNGADRMIGCTLPQIPLLSDGVSDCKEALHNSTQSEVPAH
jgi:hypothetical protein